jgi:uncharacterized membrane protein YjjP (DUF1212 family)/uncharacterized membrane protein YjjB (DUF3815 family)
VGQRSASWVTTAVGGLVAASALMLPGAALGAVASPIADAAASAVVTAPFEPTPANETEAPVTPVPTTDPVPDPDPTPSPTPEPTDTGEPTQPPATETTTPTEPPTEEPTPTPTTEPTPPTPTEEPAPTQTPAVPPASAAPTTSVVSWAIAAVVLLVAAGILVMAGRRSPAPRAGRLILPGTGSSPVVGATPVGTTSNAAPPDPAQTRAAMEAIGEAMTDAGYSVVTVRQTLEDVARANGAVDTEIIVFPTALLVSARGEGSEGVVTTGAVSSGERVLLLHQVDDLQHIVDDARVGSVDPVEIRARIRRMRALPPPYSRLQRGAAYALLSAGLSVLLGASWTGLASAAVLGAGVGAVLLASEHLAGRYRALLTVGTSFTVALVVLLGLRLGLDSGVLPALIAPLVVLLPGALLTIGSIELATGQMVSGAGRLAAGAMQLVLLAVGIIAAGALVGIPSLEVASSATTLGVVAPWIAVAMFGVGIVVYQCAPRRSLGWILVVLYVAYGAQVLGAVFFGGVLSALIGALVAMPVTALVARAPSGPAPLVSFMPAFWLLVPGALGLVGVASVLGGDSAGSASLVTTISTIVGISLGVLAGTAVSSRLGRPIL